jgi:hypothetical protein
MTMRFIAIVVLALALLHDPTRAQQLDQERVTARACEQAGSALGYVRRVLLPRREAPRQGDLARGPVDVSLPTDPRQLNMLKRWRQPTI